MVRPFTRQPYARWYRRCPVKILMPWRNLGNPGVQIGRFYADVFARPGALPGLFVSTGRCRRWITVRLSPFTLAVKKEG